MQCVSVCVVPPQDRDEITGIYQIAGPTGGSMWHRAGERSVYSPAWPGVRGVCLVCGAARGDTSSRNAQSNAVVLLPTRAPEPALETFK